MRFGIGVPVTTLKAFCFLLWCILVGTGVALAEPSQNHTVAVAAMERDGFNRTNPTAQETQTVRLTILHSGDTYGFVSPLSRADSLIGGGLAARAGVIKQLARDHNVLVLDAGDAIGPAPLASATRGMVVIKGMELAGYAAMAIGSHEFDYGAAVLRNLMQQIDFSILAANILEENGRHFAQPYKIYDVQGLRLALIGVTSPLLPTLVNSLNIAGLTFTKPVQAVRQVLAELAANNLNYYPIVLSHLTPDENLLLASQVPEIGLIIGGHVTDQSDSGGLAHLLTLANGVRILYTPRYGRMLGRVDLVFERQGWTAFHLVDFQAGLLPVTAQSPLAAEVADYLQRMKIRYQEQTNQIIGRLAQPFNAAEVGLLIANIMRYRGRTEVAFLNHGMLLLQPLDNPVTVADIDRIIRFQDVLVRLRLTGAQIRAIVKHSKTQTGSARELIVAGLEQSDGDIRLNHRRLRNSDTYWVVTTNFLASGGDGYGPFKQAKTVENTWINLHQAVRDYFQNSPDVTLADFQKLEEKPLWYSNWTIGGSLLQTALSHSAANYKGVSTLRGKDSITWDTRLETELELDGYSYNLLKTTRLAYGRVGFSGQNSRVAVDRIESDLVFQYGQSPRTLQPYASTGLKTTFSANDVGQRPVLIKGGSGFSLRLPGHANARFGFRIQDTFAGDPGPAEFGLEVVNRLNRSLPGGSRLISELTSFFSSRGKNVFSAEWYNTIRARLFHDVDLLVRVNLLLYRDNQIRAFGRKTEVNVGLGYSWGWRYY